MRVDRIIGMIFPESPEKNTTFGNKERAACIFVYILDIFNHNKTIVSGIMKFTMIYGVYCR